MGRAREVVETGREEEREIKKRAREMCEREVGRRQRQTETEID